MQTSDLNGNNTQSDYANAIFRQFQDAIFSREHTYVKTLTKIIFDLLQWQEIAKLSLPKKAAIASFIWTTFRAHFRLGANDITRNRSRVIFSSACADIFRRWTYVRTYVRVYGLYGWGRGDYQKEGRSVSGVSCQVHIFYIGHSQYSQLTAVKTV